MQTVGLAVSSVELGVVLDVRGLGDGGGRIRELPGQSGGLGALGAVVDFAFELRVGPAVDGRVLWKDINGLLAQATEVVGEDVAGIAVLHSIVI